MSGTKKILFLTLGSVLFLLLAVYLITAFYFTSHFFPKTVLNGEDISLNTAGDLVEKNIRTGQDYLLTISDREGEKYHLRGMDFSYKYENTGEEEKLLKKQNAFAWPFALFREHPLSLEASYTFNKKKLQKKIFSLPMFDDEKQKAPENARIEKDKKGIWTVTPALAGNMLLEEEVGKVLTAAVASGLTEYTLTDACYKAPEVTEDSPEIKKAMEEISSYQKSEITYEIDGEQEGLNAKEIAGMISVGENYHVYLDEDKITEYVQKLAYKYNTFGDVRTFTPTKGKKKIKIGGGDYGWVISKSREKARLLKDLKGGKPISREPVYEQTAKKSGADDIGDTYVELDLSKQHLYYIKNGKHILDTDIVSGNISNGNGSPDGIFKIVYKQSPATLVGENYQSAVTYFMPFAYNVGIHDADWRSKFGGSIYKTSGSHGCINVPKSAAQKLYRLLAVGTPVVAYYRDKVRLTSASSRIANAYSYVGNASN